MFRRIASIIALALSLAAQAFAAGELQIGGLTTGTTYYVLLFNQSGQALTTGTTFASYSTTRDTFDQPMTEVVAGTGRFKYDFPAVPAGNYSWEIYQQVGGTPSHTNDLQIGSGGDYWNGSDFGAVASVAGDVGGKVLGGGGGTITGVGARAQNEDGDTIASSSLVGDLNTNIIGINAKAIAIQAKTDNLPAQPAAVGSAMTVAAGGITSGSFASNAITAASIAADAIAASSTPSDLATEGINSNLVFTLVPGPNGPRSQDTKTIIKGSPGAAFAVDFKNVAAVNQKVYTVDSVEIVSGTSGGITFNASDAWERDGGTQARFLMTGVTAGNYVVRVKVTYTNGGRPGRGDILVKVVD